MCQSRLDYVFVSKYLSTKINKVEVDWAFEQSDHASVAVGMYLKEEIIMGPGLTRINSYVLDNPITLLGVNNKLFCWLFKP